MLSLSARREWIAPIICEAEHAWLAESGPRRNAAGQLRSAKSEPQRRQPASREIGKPNDGRIGHSAAHAIGHSHAQRHTGADA
jgi:hypothetical protein